MTGPAKSPKVPGTGEHRDAGESDWEDQDLLTLEEAGHRLEEEIHLATERLAAARADPASSASSIDLLSVRLRALQDAQRRNEGGASPLARP